MSAPTRALATDPGHPASGPAAGAMRRPAAVGPQAAHGALGWVLACALALGAAGASAVWFGHPAREALPALPDAGVAAWRDLTPLEVPVEAGGQRAMWQTNVDELRTSPVMWRRLHLEQWNAVQEPLRREALDAMLTRYRDLVANPRVWDAMTPDAWDAIPQPVRTAAYRHMVTYWAGAYHLGERAGRPAALVADTLAAIVMSESWFEHRAVATHGDGHRDLGLAQASDWTRARLRVLQRAGRVDVAFDDDEYFDPWKATRFVAIWMRLLLDATGGDLETAVRAYHRGEARAGDRRGDVYLATVRQRRWRYIANHGAPPAWDHVWRAARDIRRQAWPWLEPRSRGREAS